MIKSMRSVSFVFTAGWFWHSHQVMKNSVENLKILFLFF